MTKASAFTSLTPGILEKLVVGAKGRSEFAKFGKPILLSLVPEHSKLQTKTHEETLAGEQACPARLALQRDSSSARPARWPHLGDTQQPALWLLFVRAAFLVRMVRIKYRYLLAEFLHPETLPFPVEGASNTTGPGLNEGQITSIIRDSLQHNFGDVGWSMAGSALQGSSF